MLGRLVALTKPFGGVRALVMGDVFRRLVARPLAQQYADEFMAVTAPFQYALNTRAGSEAIIWALRAATKVDPPTTVLSIDGVRACELRRVPTGNGSPTPSSRMPGSACCRMEPEE